MRLLTLKTDDGLSLGVCQDSRIAEVHQIQKKLGNDQETMPQDIHELIRGGPAFLNRLNALVQAASEDSTLWRDESQVVFGPCVINPGKIIGVGLNYREHAQESGIDVPSTPVLFAKFANTLAGHNEPIPIPYGTDQMDYEAELAVVIGSEARQVSVENALDYVFGYCSSNDVSARDLQFLTGQWLLGKTPDKFLPIGPYLVTADEVSDPGDLHITCHINGEKRQDSNTGDMIFSVPEIISYLSQYMTLMPGDLITTGTPSGVALGMKPPRWLQAGDEMVVEVEGLGKLVNRVVAR
jgi:2-keto-4-pentenoate hydratase/2-oxohepta-3-ene-1,7-dioic acid hydratase in catechol pathway